MSKQTNRKPVTVGQGFCYIPRIDRHLMQVADGLPLDEAVTQLNCLLDCMKELAADGVGHRGISERQAWLFGFCMDIAVGLGETIENSLEAMKRGVHA